MAFTLTFARVHIMGGGAPLVSELKARNILFDEDIRAANFDLPLLEIEKDDEGDEDEDWTKIRLRPVEWSWWSLTQNWAHDTLGGPGPFAVDEVFAFESVAVPADTEGFMLGPPVPRTIDTTGFSKRMIELARDVLAFGGPHENLTVGSGPRILRELEACAESSGLPLETSELVSFVEAQLATSAAKLRPAEVTALQCIYFLRLALARNHLVWWTKM